MRFSGNVATTRYGSSALRVLTLTGAVSQILHVSNIAGVQIAQVGSEDISSTTLPNLVKEITEAFDSDPTMTGIRILKPEGICSLERCAGVPTYKNDSVTSAWEDN